MKENVCIPITSKAAFGVKAGLRNTFTGLLICVVCAGTAQVTSPHNLRNIDRTNNNRSGQQALTLSTLPSVAPRDNSINAAASPVRSTAVLLGLPEDGINVQRSAVKGSNAAIVVNPGKIMLTNTAAKLSSFTGRAANGQYLLQWEAVIENNVKQYDVEFSTNNRDYQSAGYVSANNNNNYSFAHVSDVRPAMYYRLKVIDNNGKFAYTNVLAITSALAQPEDLVAPTIIRDGVLNVTLSNSYKDLQVFNSAGVEVFREYLGGRTGNRIGFNLPALPAGAYFVKLLGSGTSVTQRVVIM
jgi:hypothetical protein